MTADESLRRGTTAGTLAKLKPVFREDGVIHAGNASQISDGASAVLITTPERAAQLGLTPLVRLHTGVVSGGCPLDMLGGPIPATQMALGRSGLSIDDIGVYEVNEAFAPVPLAWQVELGAKPKRLNPLGGAISVGHPLGASGTILTTRMILELLSSNGSGPPYLLTDSAGGGIRTHTLSRAPAPKAGMSAISSRPRGLAIVSPGLPRYR